MSYYFPGTVLMGAGALELMPAEINSLNVKKAIVITDDVLVKMGIVDQVLKVLDKAKIDYVVFSDVKPNPTVKNVHDGYEALKENKCDFVISIGGGSPQDTAKGVAILGTNGGSIVDYNGMHLSKNKALPIVAINTTAGTASEATINYVITDESRKVKMVIVDKNSMASIAVNDANLMVDMPKT
ncbi:MAG TPA: iron-containing alcohol dehydrogenase, partial [Clostridiales bacterium]|nr:iron-containing alcohol dehydrogenase [Clostridiales bacterium]